jgi:carbamoyltransferase
MIIWGISANSHDASIAVFDNDKLLFASQTERYTGVKNDPNLSASMVKQLMNRYGHPNRVCWYERPFKKTLRQLWSGQGLRLRENNIERYLKQYGIEDVSITYIDHHHSHAAAAFYTAPWFECAVLCIDSIGEWDTTSIWKGRSGYLKKKWTKTYPDSLGLFYSAMTQRIGLKPQEDEYILMGMAAYGDPTRLKDRILEDMWENSKLTVNLHKGYRNWAEELTSEQDLFDIAAATQSIYEDRFRELLQKTKDLTGATRIALAGGCALNCLANTIAWEYFDDVWIFPNPGDSGSSVGAVLAHTCYNLTWENCYLGYDIVGKYPVDYVLKDLLNGTPVGVANGRAEFGPRALGNRSLLADPRSNVIKTRVNDIKKRQQFRPFAPAILEEHASEYFDLTHTSHFMQYAVKCTRPDELPAIVHYDNTSRVQTVPNDGSGFRRLLEAWYAATGCPVLLNTSLNIKGQPIVNDRRDADLFKKYYDVPVHCSQI